MKAIIENLKSLNKIDVQMQTLKKDIERLPRELSERHVQPRALKSALERAKAEITRLKLEAETYELEVKSGEDALKRLASQMNALRTSKEFESVKRQMDAQRVWNRENENKALDVMVQADTKQKEIDKNSAALAEAEAQLAVDAEVVAKEVAVFQAEYDALAAQRAGMAKDVPEKELVIYTRIATGRGQAIAYVDRGICSACYMKIPPQIHNLALLGREMVCCPSCTRILTPSV
jgi:predicted  nucleic acid-binding Zn-ribbon protein